MKDPAMFDDADLVLAGWLLEGVVQAGHAVLLTPQLTLIGYLEVSCVQVWEKVQRPT